MPIPTHAAVDWGTSSFRLWLVDDAGAVLAERRSAEGMTHAATAGFPAVLESHLEAIGAPADLPVIICGMAGARQGWVEAGYLDVPASLADILRAAVRVPGQSRDIRILPGLAQRAVAAPDVIRGEETQLLGALTGLDQGDQAVCMPGTHSKWVHVQNGLVTGFSTFMTGEIFDVMSRHSILSHAVAGADGTDETAFVDAVAAAYAKPALATAFLFSPRPAQLLHGISADAARSRLSGTLIGLEIAGALSSASSDTRINLVVSGRLQPLYEAAFRRLALDFTTIDADKAVLRGLNAAANAIWFTPKERPTA